MPHRTQRRGQCTVLRAGPAAAQAAKAPPALGVAEEAAVTQADRARQAGEAAKAADAGARVAAAALAAALAGSVEWAAAQEGGAACSMERAGSVAVPGVPGVGMRLSSCRCPTRPVSTLATRHRCTGHSQGGPLPQKA